MAMMSEFRVVGNFRDSRTSDFTRTITGSMALRHLSLLPIAPVRPIFLPAIQTLRLNRIVIDAVPFI